MSTIVVAVIVSVLSVTSAYFDQYVAHGQDEEQLPVLLIHGYNNDASVWNGWIDDLNDAGINVEAVTFGEEDSEYDACGSAEDHASDLEQKVEVFKSLTQAEKINLVAHSKGGLDARVYLANNLANDDVANLVMIGTPNRGSPLADHFVREGIIVCDPAIYDLLQGSNATKVSININTKYHTIASNWVSEYVFPLPFLRYDINCPAPLSWFAYEEWKAVGLQEWARHQVIEGPDDGMVPLRSADPGGQFFRSLGHTDNCHTNLFTQEELDKVLSILKQE